MSTGETIPIESLLQHESWIRRLAHELVRDEARAEDLVQETWLAAAERPPAPGHARGWLAQVLRRGAKREARSGARRRTRELAAARPDATVEDTIERVQLQRELVSRLLELPENYRRPLVLRYFEDLGPAAIGEQLGLPTETVRTRLKRGLAMIRAEFGRERDETERRAALIVCAGAGASLGRDATMTTLAGGTLVAASTKTISTVIALSLLLAVFAGWKLLGQGDESVVLDEDDGDTPTHVEAPRRNDESAPPIAPESETEEERSEAAGVAKQPARNVVATTRKVAGRILGPDGDPVPGSTVFVYAVAADETGYVRDLRELTSQHAQSGLPGHATTDDQGRFEAELQDSAARLAIGAFHPDIGYGLRGGIAVEGTLTEVDVSLQAGIVIHGRVTTKDGEPLPEATIGVMGSLADGGFSHVAHLTTDGDGRYRTHPLPYPKVLVDANVPGYCDAHSGFIEPLPSQREVRADFELEPARVVTGRLLGPDGKPFDIAVHARELVGAGAATWMTRNRFRVFSDYSDPEEDPNYLSLGHTTGKVDAKAATYRIELDNPQLDWISIWIGNNLMVKATLDASTSELDLVLDIARLPAPLELVDVEIIVEDAETGLPVGAYDFDLYTGIDDDDDRGRRRGSSTAGDGRHLVSGVRTGRATLTVTTANYAVAYRDIVLSANGGPPAVKVALRRATGSLKGRVRNVSRSPVGGAQVRFLSETGALTAPPSHGFVTTDEQGRFVMNGIAAERGLVVVTAARHAPVLVAADANPGSPDIEIEMTPGIEISIAPKGSSGPFRFRILDARGLPLEDDEYTWAQRWGSGFKFRVPAADLILETRVPGYATSRLEFHPADAKKLEPVLTRE